MASEAIDVVERNNSDGAERNPRDVSHDGLDLGVDALRRCGLPTVEEEYSKLLICRDTIATRLRHDCDTIYITVKSFTARVLLPW
jgi:hypothetical protein